MLHNTDTAAGVAATSLPGLAYSAWVYLIGLPVEKWVSGLTGIFIAMQMIFLLVDRMKKRRGKRGHNAA
jgi:hypothetical protein